MKIFVASWFENKDAVRALEAKLRAAGHEVTSDWVEQGPLEDVELAPSYSIDDLENVGRSDVLIVLWPGMNGTMTEFGFALGRDLDIILHGDVPIERGVIGGNIHFHSTWIMRTRTDEELLLLLEYMAAEREGSACLIV